MLSNTSKEVLRSCQRSYMIRKRNKERGDQVIKIKKKVIDKKVKGNNNSIILLCGCFGKLRTSFEVVLN